MKIYTKPYSPVILTQMNIPKEKFGENGNVTIP